MLVVTRYRVPEDAADTFAADAESAMTVLAAREGLIDAWLGRNTDDPELWTLTLLWRDPRAYRCALSDYDVKITAVPLLSRALDEPSAYVVVGRWTADTDAGGSLERC